MTQHTTVYRTTIKLREDTEMCTGYIGRGQRSLTKTFPAGTTAVYERFRYNGKYIAHDGDKVTSTHHVVSVVHDGYTYQAVKIVEAGEQNAIKNSSG